MLAISVELLHGTFRGDPDGTANTGRLTRGEWPPSPARLFAALVAADGTREKCRVTDGTELAWFERLPPPVIYADSRPLHQKLKPRYVVEHRSRFVIVKRRNTVNLRVHQEYIGRVGTAIRAGVRVAPRCPHIVYSWNVEPPAQSTLDALRRRAARIGYLGASDSTVRVRVTTCAPPSAGGNDTFIPDEQGDAVIDVTAPGDLQVLDRMYDAWCKRGASVSRLQFPALRHGCGYRSPLLAQPIDRGEVVAWLRLGAAVSGRRISVVAALFKQAILSHYQRIHGRPPAVLHGHGFKGTGYEIARYLALPDVGYRWSRGRIHGLALWVPAGCESIVLQMARDAAFAVRRLTGQGIDVSVAPRGDDSRPFAACPDRWLRPSRGWVTALPAIHERRHPLDLAELARWCRHAGLPDPVSFRSARTPLVAGAVDLAPVEVNRPNRPALPYSHVELWFNHAVPGPVVIGSGRQRGFGLCIPVDD